MTQPWVYIVIVVGALFALEVVDALAHEAVSAWKGIADMGYKHTPYNLALYLYCQVEAHQFIVMEEFSKMFKKGK